MKLCDLTGRRVMVDRLSSLPVRSHLGKGKLGRRKGYKLILCCTIELKNYKTKTLQWRQEKWLSNLN